MLFFEQDRIATTSASTSSTKPITTIGTIVVVVIAVDGDVGGTAVALVIVVVDSGVMVEHIDPDEPENMEDSCALKRIQAYPQSVRLKDVAR